MACTDHIFFSMIMSSLKFIGFVVIVNMFSKHEAILASQQKFRWFVLKVVEELLCFS